MSGRRGGAAGVVALGVVMTVVASSCAVLGPLAAGPSRPVRADGVRYVALGDSYTSGPLLPEMSGDPIDCGRSSVNYPSLVARALEVDTFVDASCGSAKTTHMTEVQDAALGSEAPPQFDALTPDTDVVTVGIGGNDVGFSGSVLGCVNLLPIPVGDAPWGRPCINKRIVDGVDEMSVKIAQTRPKIDAVLRGIRERAPDAAVFLVGYPVTLPTTGDGCWPTVPLLGVDVHYLREKYLEMNRMLADAARAADGVTYVDVYASSIGHDVCQGYGVAWINTINIDPAGLPLHPNYLSHRNTAADVTAAIRSELGD